MATRTSSTKVQSTPATTGTTVTTSQPQGSSAKVAEGTPQQEVEALVKVITALEVALATPEAAWPGYGKAVRLAGGQGTVYLNRGNADIRSTPTNVARWVKAGHGKARGPQGQYLRMAL